MPPRREPDDEKAGFAARLQHAPLARLSQQRLRPGAPGPLAGPRAVRERAAGVAPAVFRDCGGTCEPEWRMVGAREPGAELDGRPVVLGPSEGDEHGTLGRRVPTGEQRHVAGRLRKEGTELL